MASPAFINAAGDFCMWRDRVCVQGEMVTGCRKAMPGMAW